MGMAFPPSILAALSGEKNSMKVCHLSTYDCFGGAARATNRLHQAYCKAGIPSRMQVAVKHGDLSTVDGSSHKFQKAVNFLKPRLGIYLMRLQQSPQLGLHSPALFPSRLTQKLNASDADLLHLHWICDEFLSVEEIGRLRKPLVWTLHDMWAFAGAEHYTGDTAEARWRVGYTSQNRPVGHRGLDLDRWVWNRKRRAWKQRIHIVTPSQWLADCVKDSYLMGNWSISVIPNVLDTERFRPWDKMMARQILGLPQKQQLVLFGAMKGGQYPRKGWDLLQLALAKLSSNIANFAGVVFGESEPKDPPQLGLPLYWLGHLSDETTLALLYSAADVTVVPSRQDNLPQAGTEAQSCGCPVVAFKTGGLPSVVGHGETGYLATPFDTDDLAQGIQWVLADQERYEELSKQARDRAVQLWSAPVIVKQYLEVYQQVIARSSNQ
jgi:glycosyltransferase involved in cell wall biosynthesis